MTIEALQAELEAERAARRAAEETAAETLAALHFAIGRTLDLAEPLEISDSRGSDLAGDRLELYQRVLEEAATAGGTAVSEKRKDTIRPPEYLEVVAANPAAWAVTCEPAAAEALKELTPDTPMLSLPEVALRHTTGLPLTPQHTRSELTAERLPTTLFVVACNTPSDASPLLRAINKISRAKVLPIIPRGLLLLLKQKQISFDDWFGAALEAEGHPKAAVLVADAATLTQMQQMARANRCPLLRKAMMTAHVIVFSWSDKSLGWAHKQILTLGKSLSFFSEGDARLAVPGYRTQLREDQALIELAANPILFKQATVSKLYVDCADFDAIAQICATAGFVPKRRDDQPVFPRLEDERATTLSRMLMDAVDQVIDSNEAPASAAGGLVSIAKAQEQAERYADALASYQLALEKEPSDFSVRLATARYLELAGRIEEAERTLRAGVPYSTSSRDTVAPLRDFYRRRGDPRKTLAVARLMARANPSVAPLAFAMSLVETGKPEKALDVLERAEGLHAATHVHKRIRTVATLAASVPAVRRQAEKSGAASDHFALAEVLRQTNDPVAAKAAYEAAIEADPTIVSAVIGPKAGPEFFVVGPPRTATTLLRRLLELSPKLGLIEGESAFLTNREPLPLQAFADKANEVRGARPDVQLVGDKSPQHFALSDDHIALARTLFPHAKIIITTRDPVARAWSEIKLFRHARVVETNIVAALGGGTTPPWLEEIFDNSRYLTHSRKWVRHFGMNNVLLVQTEGLERNVVAGCKRIYRWLGVDLPPAAEIESLQQSWSNRTFEYAMHPDLAELLRQKCGGEIYRVEDLRAALSEEFAPPPVPATAPAEAAQERVADRAS